MYHDRVDRTIAILFATPRFRRRALLPSVVSSKQDVEAPQHRVRGDNSAATCACGTQSVVRTRVRTNRTCLDVLPRYRAHRLLTLLYNLIADAGRNSLLSPGVGTRTLRKAAKGTEEVVGKTPSILQSLSPTTSSVPLVSRMNTPPTLHQSFP